MFFFSFLSSLSLSLSLSASKSINLWSPLPKFHRFFSTDEHVLRASKIPQPYSKSQPYYFCKGNPLQQYLLLSYTMILKNSISTSSATSTATSQTVMKRKNVEVGSEGEEVLCDSGKSSSLDEPLLRGYKA